jgi:hypothetical protein
MGWIKGIQIVCIIVAVGLWIIPLIELHNLWRGFKSKDANADNVVKKYEDRYKLIKICILLASIFSLLSIIIRIFNM